MSPALPLDAMPAEPPIAGEPAAPSAGRSLEQAATLTTSGKLHSIQQPNGAFVIIRARDFPFSSSP
jgi:hypothetical protein